MKQLIAFARSNIFSDIIYMDLVAGQQRYLLPVGTSTALVPWGLEDFASVIELEIGYRTLTDGTPDRKVCVQVNSPEYLQKKLDNKNKDFPNYRFDGKDAIVLFPIPDQNIVDWIYLRYNYVERDWELTDDESKMQIPWYLLDTMEFYLDYRLKCTESWWPEYAQVEKGIREDEFYRALGMASNRDERGVVEEALNLRHLM